MSKHRSLLAVLCLLAFCSVAVADDLDPQLAAIEKTFKYQTGDIVVGSNLATLHLGKEYRFLGSANAKTVLVDCWGNPPSAVNDVMGLIVPAKVSPLADAGWAVVVSYDDDGHIDDSDAAEIDYTKMLKQMQKAEKAENAERKKQGYDGMNLVGWAKQPSYDSGAKKLIWAKEFHVEGSPENTLNYDVRVLGREGTLSLNAVAGMAQLGEIESAMVNVSKKAEFNAGQRYADFNASTDKLATYGVAGLVAGTLAAKTGLLKGLFLALLAAKKLVIVALIGLGVAVKKVISMISSRGQATNA